MKLASFWILKRILFLFIKKLQMLNFSQEIMLIAGKISESLDFYTKKVVSVGGKKETFLWSSNNILLIFQIL